MRRQLVMLLACVWFVAVLPGAACMQQALPVLTKIASVLINAQTQTDRIDGYVQEFLRATNADEATRIEYANIRDSVLLGIEAARAATEGAADLSQEDYIAAFAEFNRAWQKLEAFLTKTGAMSGGVLSAGGGSVPMPQPLALQYKAGE